MGCHLVDINVHLSSRWQLHPPSRGHDHTRALFPVPLRPRSLALAGWLRQRAGKSRFRTNGWRSSTTSLCGCGSKCPSSCGRSLRSCPSSLTCRRLTVVAKKAKLGRFQPDASPVGALAVMKCWRPLRILGVVFTCSTALAWVWRAGWWQPHA